MVVALPPACRGTNKHKKPVQKNLVRHITRASSGLQGMDDLRVGLR
jgi:hypothetical protein